MKKMYLFFVIALLFFAGCSSGQEEVTKVQEPQQQIHIPVENASVAPLCEEPYVEFEGDCCLDNNKNSICDNIDLSNYIKAEYNFVSNEIGSSEFVKVIGTGASDGEIGPSDKMKIYLKLDDKASDVKLEEILIKMDHISGGKTMYYNESLGEKVYNLTYLSNEGVPKKKGYITPSDVVLFTFTPDVTISTSEYLYLRVFTISGLFIPMHINTPNNFDEENITLYP